MSGKIFLSYRRSDTKAYTHVVAQLLINHFGEDQVFLDVYDIELGRDFVEVLEQAVSSCDEIRLFQETLAKINKLHNPSDLFACFAAETP